MRIVRPHTSASDLSISARPSGVVGSAVEKKIVELLGDPDAGLEIREHVRKRLLRQKRAVAKGDRGEPLENVVRRLKLG